MFRTAPKQTTNRFPSITSFRLLAESSGNDPTSESTEYMVQSDSEVLARVVQADGFDAPEHAHPEAQISLFRRGLSAVFLTHTPTGRANRTSVSPGAVAFITPHQPHRTHWQGEGELMNIYFPQEFMERMTDSHKSGRALHCLSYRQEPVIDTIGQCLLDEFYWSGNMQAELVDHARFLVATRLLRIQEANTSRAVSGLLSVKRLQPAIEFLNEHSDRSTTLANLAGLCGSSVYHFARSFSARLGCAPFVYQRSLRLRKAQDLLRGSDLAIEAVGIAVGIESASTFSRLFRRETGVTPTAFRRLHLSTIGNRVHKV